MTPTEFKARFAPQFASTDPDRIQQELDDAVPEFDVARWGDRYTRGIGLLVAHRLAVAGVDPFFGTGSGSSTTKEVGSVKLTRSTSFNAKVSNDDLNLTTYGRQFKALVRSVGAGALAV